jgi:excisionase family DNA binding protein
MEHQQEIKNTLNEWITKKGLPIYQVGKKTLIKKSDIEKFMKKYRKIMPVLILSLSEISDAGALLLGA